MGSCFVLEALEYSTAAGARERDGMVEDLQSVRLNCFSNVADSLIFYFFFYLFCNYLFVNPFAEVVLHASRKGRVDWSDRICGFKKRLHLNNG